MLTEEEDYDLRGVLNQRMELGNSLLSELSSPDLNHISGLPKLIKKIKQELRFLQKFLDTEFRELRKEHLECSNLIHLESLVHQISRRKNIVSVLQPFNLHRAGTKTKKVCVDIVCDEGYTWVKVVARNPLALQLNSKGETNFGQKNIIDQAKEFSCCAKQNMIMFKHPQVVFSFSNGVSKSLSQVLQRKGVHIHGQEIDLDDSIDDQDDQTSDEELSQDESDLDSIEDQDQTSQQMDESSVNLDITAMIAYVSNLTNGGSNFVFQEKILTEQAEWERQNPVKPSLDKMFENKTLVCCESALKDFQSIIGCLGGSKEKGRADVLVSRLNIVPDSTTQQFQNLVLGGKIKARSCAIFGTGDALRIPTVTANSGFVRAARGQGLNLAVLLHESRALTEDKEPRAEEL